MKNMFPFLASSFLMSAVTEPETAPTGGAPAPAPAPAPEKEKKAKKQHTVTLFEKDKEDLFALMGEFHGPQASNEDEKRFLSTAEGFRVVWEVASAKRFGPETEMVQKVDENGQPEFDTDNQPVMVESPVDNFAIAAAKVIEARGIVRKENKVKSLEAQLAALQAQLAARNGAPATEGETVEG